MPKISGYLKDGAAKPVADCAIILSALKTSNDVIEQIESCTTAKDGFYEINALAGQYEVILSITGRPPKKVGMIRVYSDSPNGTLNDFLVMPDNSEASPAFIAAVTELRNQTVQAKNQAETAKNDAVQTLNNTVKKTGESSQNISGSLTINNIPVLKQGDSGLGGSIRTMSNVDYFNTPNGFYYSGTATVGTKPFTYASVITSTNGSSEGSQLAFDMVTNKIKARTSSSGIWRPWVDILTSDNIDKYAFTNRGGLGTTDLNALTGTKQGFYYQYLNVNATEDRNYPINKAGSLQIYQNNADTPEGCTQKYIPYHMSKEFIRIYFAKNNEWSSWEEHITTANIQNYALPLTGGVLSGDLTILKSFAAINIRNVNNNGISVISENNGNIAYKIYDGSSFNLKHYYEKGSNTWNFTNLTAVNIDGKPILKQGDGGLLSSTGATSASVDSYQTVSGMYGVDTNQFANNPYGTGRHSSALLHLATKNVNYKIQLLATAVGSTFAELWIRGVNSNSNSDWQKFITTANSTIDANGFYKKASPVVRLINPDSQAAIDECIEDNLQNVGGGFANEQASDVAVKYLATGHYEIHGSLGFAKSGWYIETPQDANGNKKLFVEYSTDQNKVITVKSYENCFDNGRFVAGKPMDVPDGRWIDIRLTMPEIIAEPDIQPSE